MSNTELQKVFTQVYEGCVWGGTTKRSGEGSHSESIVNPYVDSIINFLKSLDQKLKIVDLGCGDFNVGSRLVPYSSEYIACDIVEFVIEENKKRHPDVNFSVVDITTDELPKGDVAIIRQVLQHLSVEDITKVVNKLENSSYQYVIVTEHLPVQSFEPNKDMSSGSGNRMALGSGVILTEEPFCLKTTDEKLISSISLGKNDVLKTIVYQLEKNE